MKAGYMAAHQVLVECLLVEFHRMFSTKTDTTHTHRYDGCTPCRAAATEYVPLYASGSSKIETF